MLLHWRTALYLHRRLRAEDGQTMAEYGMVLALIVVVTMVAYVTLGTAVAGLLSKVAAIA